MRQTQCGVLHLAGSNFERCWIATPSVRQDQVPNYVSVRTPITRAMTNCFVYGLMEWRMY